MRTYGVEALTKDLPVCVCVCVCTIHNISDALESSVGCPNLSSHSSVRRLCLCSSRGEHTPLLPLLKKFGSHTPRPIFVMGNKMHLSGYPADVTLLQTILAFSSEHSSKEYTTHQHLTWPIYLNVGTSHISFIRASNSGNLSNLSNPENVFGSHTPGPMPCLGLEPIHQGCVPCHTTTEL